MGKDYSICVGAVGFGGGVWHSADGGDKWNRIRDPFPLGSQVRGMAVYPDNPNRILAGSEHGIYRTEDCGATWEKMWSPMEGMPIWSIAIDPQNTDNIFVGIKPAALFRSQDGGQSWSKLSAQMAQECHIGPPMVTMLMVDPQDSRTVWAGVEVDGVYRSLDGGDTWTHVQGGVHPDIHGMALTPGASNKVLASTPREIYATADMGESWQSVVTTDKFVFSVQPGHRLQARRPQRPLCRRRRHGHRQHRGRPALHGRGGDVGDAAPAGGAELQHLEHRHAPGGPGLRACVQSLGRGLSEHRRRRLVGQAEARVQRDRGDGLGSQLECWAVICTQKRFCCENFTPTTLTLPLKGEGITVGK